MMVGLSHDLRHAFRLIASRPAFSLFVILVLALGIGANSTVFGVVNEALFDRLSFANIDRLVLVHERNLSVGADESNVSFPNYSDYVERSGVFEKAAVATETTRNLTGLAAPRRLKAVAVSPEFFDVFGLPLKAGRSFVESDQDIGSPRVVILSESFWTEQLSAGTELVGSTVRIDGEPHMVIGVAPWHSLYADADIWVPLAKSEVVLARTNHFLTVYGALRADVSHKAAQSRLNDVAKALEMDYPAANEGWSAVLSPLRAAHARDAAPLFVLLLSVVGLVLLLACANVAGLFIARASEREREIAVRLALGAGHGRLVRQLLIENLVFALLAGVVGTFLGFAGMRLVAMGVGSELPIESMKLSPAVLLATLVLSVIVGFLFGLGPALFGARAGLDRGLSRGGAGSAGRRLVRARSALVVGQVSVSLPLLVLALSFLLVFQQSRTAELGFEPEGLLTLRLDLPAAKYPDTASRARVMDNLREEIASLPGIVDVGYSTNLPFSGNSTMRGVVRFGEEPPPRDQVSYANFVAVSPGYVPAVGLHIVDGRPIADREARSEEPLVLINETLARQLFGSVNVAGEQLWIHTDEREAREIVGVFADVRSTDLRRGVSPEMLVPTSQYNQRQQWLAVRSQQPPEQVINSVRKRVAAVDPDQPIYGARTMGQLLAKELAMTRVLSIVMGGFGVTALGLALLGLYGLVAIAARQRRREAAIRITLGATANQVVRRIMHEGLRATAIGLAIGLTVCLGAQRMLGSRMRELSELAELVPMSAFVAAVLLGLSALIACYRPARRVSRSEPSEALRADA